MTFARFWAADTVSLVGTHVTAFALSFLAMDQLGADVGVLGVLSAAQWVPYLLFGLLAGVLADRVRRRPLLIGADVARAAVLAMIPTLHAIDVLTMPALIGLVAVFGTLSLLYDAAHQSFLPKLVPPERLTTANARMEQTRAVTQTSGPLVAGWLVKTIGAPLAIVVDAVSYLLSALVLATLKVAETPPARESRSLKREIREGLRWVYRHDVLAPIAITSHAWFLFNSMIPPVFAYFAHIELGFDEFGVSLTFAAAGAGAVLGATASPAGTARLGAGRMIVTGRWLTPAAYALIPFADPSTTGLTLLAAAQFTWGLGVGLDSAPEMGYRQAITPDHLQGRMNATIRSLNRGMIVVGAPVGGLIADLAGTRTAVWVAVTGLTAQAVAITCSPVRRARIPQQPQPAPAD